jgi:plasmid stabilization system protein ParE
VTISFFDDAKEELEEATRYYERQRPGLGDEFAEEVRKTLERIRNHPGAWTNLGEGVRRCRTDRFPYGLVYFVKDEDILIVAVMHLHRNPGYWRDRL